MTALEREVIEKFYQLDKAAQKRVRELIVQEIQSIELAETPTFDFEAWWKETEALQVDIQARIGHTGTIGSLSLLDELREESS
jgi:hypothetical protein